MGTWGDYQIRKLIFPILGGVPWKLGGITKLGNYFLIRKLFKTPISGFKRILVLFRGYKSFSLVIIFCIMHNNVISG